ncbi:FAD:protein FMN transferase [bacterium RCC_150]
MQPTSNPARGGDHRNATGARLRSRTFTSMGTVVSLAIPCEPGPASHPVEEELEAATAVVERLFNELDETFSLYRPDSEASAMARGELALSEASAQMRELYRSASEWRISTEGAFTAERPDGVVDLAGIVKAHAILKAGTSLRALGLRDWCINAGGDVLVEGSPIHGGVQPWLAGVVDPEDRGALLTAFPLGRGGLGRGGGLGGGGEAGGREAAAPKQALATSGTSERGQHIWSAGRPVRGPGSFRQVSVAAPDIITADVLATAIMAGGAKTLSLATGHWDVEVLAVKNDGGLLATPGFRAR